MGLLKAVLQPYKAIDRKVYTQDQAVKISEPLYAVIPLEYPGQILYMPEVKIGDLVRKNQIIGRSKFGHCIHAPFSGEIKDILLIWTTSVYHVPAILILRNDDPPCSVNEIFEQFGIPFEAASYRDKLKALGVPTPWTRPGRFYQEADKDYPDIEKIVIYAADEEPSIFVNDMLVAHYAEKLARGITHIRTISPLAKIYLTVSENQKNLAEQEFGAEVTVCALKKHYADRLELLVVPQITDTPISPTAAFRSQGVARISAEFLIRMVDALENCQPFTTKTITVAGSGLAAPITVEMPIGTTIRHLFTELQIDMTRVKRLIAGGPLKGIAQYTDLTPITKKDTGIYIMAESELSEEPAGNCINCGNCVRACPINLQIQLIGRCAEFEMLHETQKYHPDWCIGCGLCAYVCPAHRPLVQLIEMCNKYYGKDDESSQQQIECSPHSALEKWDNDLRNAETVVDMPAAGVHS
jgi:electron transport complex protein RnfC